MFKLCSGSKLRKIKSLKSEYNLSVYYIYSLCKKQFSSIRIKCSSNKNRLRTFNSSEMKWSEVKVCGLKHKSMKRFTKRFSKYYIKNIIENGNTCILHMVYTIHICITTINTFISASDYKSLIFIILTKYNNVPNIIMEPFNM